MNRLVLAVLVLLLVVAALGQRSTKKSSQAQSDEDPVVSKLRSDCGAVKGTFIQRPHVDCQRESRKPGMFGIGDTTRATCCYQRSSKEVREARDAVSQCTASLGAAFFFGKNCPINSNPVRGVPVVNIKGATYTCCKASMTTGDRSRMERSNEIAYFARSCEPFFAARLGSCDRSTEKEMSSKFIRNEVWKCCASFDSKSGAYFL